MPEAYPLEALLRVRRLRESDAERAVSTAQSALRASREALEAKRAAFEQWIRWRTEEVDRRYAAFLGKKTAIAGVLDFNGGIAALYAEEAVKKDEIARAEKDVAACEARLDEARAAAKRARKNTAKIEIHKSIWMEDEKKARERAEDKEFEEFKGAPRTDADS